MDEVAARPTGLYAKGGPWSGGSDDEGANRGAGDTKPDSDGAESSDTPGGRRNPWSPPPLGPRPPRGPRGPSLEDYLRRRGNPLGPLGQLPGMDGRRWWLVATAVLILLWIATTSFWLIGPQQSGVITTFGRYTRTVGPGPAITLPAPFERLAKVDTGAINTLSIGNDGDADDNRVLTSDSNIIDMAYEVRWSVRDPVLYLFQLDNPAGSLKDVAESAMRATVANFSLNEAIGPGRQDIQNRVAQRMQQVLDAYRSGIVIQGVNIRQSDPPAEVMDAFKAVNAARQQRESFLNDARAYQQQVIERARGDAAAFDKVYAQYKLAPEVTRRRMYYDTMEGVLSGVDKTIIEAPGMQGYIPLPALKPPPADDNATGDTP